MKAKALIAALALLLTAGFTARAEGTWSVSETSYNSSTKTTTFTISRTETTYEQKVLYRTVGLTAYNGQHFTETYGELTFQAGTPSMTVQVQEKTSPANAYRFQQGSTERSYMLEVTDRAGYRLADCTRTMSNGTSVTGSGLFNTKDVTIQASEYTADDSGYNENGYKSVAASSYCNSGTQAYLSFLGAELRMTLSFDAKENDDAYSYLQILVDNTSSCDGRSGKSDGHPGTPSLSRYMAGFEMNSGDKDATYRSYTFPVTSVGSDVGATNPWGYGDKWPLTRQMFNTNCRATDGRLILPTNFSTLVLRLNASGKSGSDEWAAKNVKAHIEAIDPSAPTKLAARVNPGRHAKGNSFYVSVAFSEIVTSTDATLSTSWGNMTLLSGSGTNVLTFKGTIKADADGALNISGKGGTISDLAGKEFTTSINQDNLATLDADLAYTLNDFKMEGGAYLITCHDDLNGLAGYVNGGNNASGLTFRQVTNIVFPHTTNWNNSSSTENNFTAIGKSGGSSYQFNGTYDGEGHTISGIRIYKGGKNVDVDNYQGLFGEVGSSGTVRNVNLSDSRITGFDSVGGIAGISFGTVEGCTVTANVCLHIVQDKSNCFGGIVGNNRGNIYRCVSRACITLKSGISSTFFNGFGGIAGHNYGQNTITDCIAEGVTIPNINGRGVILGYDENSGVVILTRNYYLGCTVAGVSNATGVGQGTYDSTNTSDPVGAQPLWAVTLPAHTSLVRTGTNLPITGYATYDNGADIAGVPYAKATSTLNLSYDSAAISQGHDVVITAAETSSGNPVAVTDNGNHTYTIASMPAADITVTATEVPVVSYIDADGTEQSVVNPIVIESSNSDVNLGSSGETHWYVVSSDVTINGQLCFKNSHSHIVVCDGATLTVTSSSDGNNAIRGYDNGDGITIYGQTLGSGTINATSISTNAIYARGPVTINGGIINATGKRGICVAIYDLTINGGSITATATGSSNGIEVTRNVIINGGNINATGGIMAHRDITLGCRTAADRITASSYSADGDIKVATGQTLTDGTAAYTGTLTSEEIAAIAGKTLQSAAGAVFYIDADGVQRVCVGATQITSSGFYGSNSNAEGWYYVSGEVSLNSRLVFSDQNVHLIICDGANLIIDTSNSSNAALVFLRYASIYGQSGGSGSITITSKDNGIGISASISTFSINGGNISVVASEGSGISTNGDVLIRRGTVNVTGSYGIRGASISILGGNVTATGTDAGIISRSNLITLGWSESGDSITASSYRVDDSDGALLIATGQALSDGTNTYTGLLSTEQIAAIAGKTLRPAENPSDDNLGLTARKSKFGGISKYFTTFYHPTKNYKLLDGAQAFTLNGSKQFYLVGDGSIVPAGCAVIIFADKPAVSLTAIDISNPPSPVGTNILQGVGVATAASTLVTGTQKVYVISGNNNSIGLYEYTGTTIPAYKAYIIVE